MCKLIGFVPGLVLVSLYAKNMKTIHFLYCRRTPDVNDRPGNKLRPQRPFRPGVSSLREQGLFHFAKGTSIGKS